MDMPIPYALMRSFNRDPHFQRVMAAGYMLVRRYLVASIGTLIFRG